MTCVAAAARAPGPEQSDWCDGVGRSFVSSRSLARVFADDDTLRIFGRVFWKSSERPTITLAVTGAGVSQRQAAPLSATAVSHDRSEAAFDTMLPLKVFRLRAGHYQLAIDAHLRNGPTIGRVIVFDVK